MLKYFLICLLFLTLLPACNPTNVAPPRTAEYYFKQGESFFDRHLYADAVASWQKVRDSYYSPELNKLAELKIAEAHYLAGDFVKAAANYSTFRKAHPDDERLADVLYFLGKSYYAQMLSKDRDQTTTVNALKVFRSLVADFPSNKRAEEVRVLIQRCRNRLAGHEVYVGRFYLRTGHYQAAVNRLTEALDKFSNYYRRDEALFYLGSAYIQLKQKKKAAATFNTLFDQFPDSRYIIKSQKILGKNY